ncbi:hypothetical protein [Coleofasciculus chthonoplastes]|nr:hypothetical protein [Coleofasciculus chthonoplastes]
MFTLSIHLIHYQIQWHSRQFGINFSVLPIPKECLLMNSVRLTHGIASTIEAAMNCGQDFLLVALPDAIASIYEVLIDNSDALFPSDGIRPLQMTNDK